MLSPRLDYFFSMSFYLAEPNANKRSLHVAIRYCTRTEREPEPELQFARLFGELITE